MRLKLNSKILFYIVVLFGIVSLIDVITAMFILPHEANPIYILTGSPLVMWIMKLGLVALVAILYFFNKYPSRILYFSFVYTLIIGTLLFSFGAFSNIRGMADESVIEYNEELTDKDKVVAYSQIVTVLMIIPYTIAMLAFYVYDKSVTKVRLEDKHGNPVDRR